ncbi:hypothetical protein [Methylorubrum extorquens]|uniref:hypothetical protein n=1 Tax=Methylorubrum extorquens TaxID=408 RepID=UPI00209D88F1|nr:hypothetical protein [Methylorubrum extorquens]
MHGFATCRIPTAGELFKAKAVADDQVNAAVDAHRADSGTIAHPNADGYGLDFTAAVAEHGWASSVIASPKSSPSLTRGAILRARAQEV